MNFDDFKKIIADRQSELRKLFLPSNITAAQFKMLQHLWDAGDSFPRNWVPREELHNLVNQSDYRRRLTELKDERGIDIELNRKNNSYRLRSPNLKLAHPRAYLAKAQKNSLFVDQNHQCQICGTIDVGNIENILQADHKVPLVREGSHNESNWQTLCYVCNVGKRRACENCNRECRKCVWAFPEKSGIRFVVPLKQGLLDKLRKAGLADHDDIVEWLQRIAEKALS